MEIEDPRIRSKYIIHIKRQENVETDMFSCLPSNTGDMDAILNHPPLYPHKPFLNKSLWDLTFIHHHKNKNEAFLKGRKENNQFIKL